MTPRKKQIIWILILFACVVLVDQTTKALVMAAHPEPARWLSMDDGPRFFQISHQRNPGVVNGIFRHQPALALAAPLLATCVLLYLFRFVDPASKVQTAAFGLIAGGAVGNLIDRLRLGSVTDFLQFHFYFIPFDFPWKLYPAFNVADSCICTGVFLLIVSWYWVGRRDAVHTT